MSTLVVLLAIGSVLLVVLEIAGHRPHLPRLVRGQRPGTRPQVPASVILALVGIAGITRHLALSDVLSPVASHAWMVAVVAIGLAFLVGMSLWADRFVGWIGAVLAALDASLTYGPGAFVFFLVILTLLIWVYGLARRLSPRR